MIAIVDYGVGNLGSIRNMFAKVGIEAEITSSEAEITHASGLLFPGVGAFDPGMANLEESGLIPALRKAVFDAGLPILGICLGMQLLMEGSEEGQRPGLGWIEGSCKRFRVSAPDLKVPHMGWAKVEVVKHSPLFSGISDPRFYFLHSYYAVCDRDEDVSGRTRHEEVFVSAFERDNIYGVQFHPEKSHRFGMQLLRNFAALGG